MRELKYLKTSDLKPGVRVIMRIDANISFEGGISETPPRLIDAIKDMKAILSSGASLAIIGHRGRPKGQEQSLSLKPLVSFLAKKLDHEVKFMKDIQAPPSSERVVLLENLRFFKGESKDSRKFAKKLAEMGDIFVNNAFGVCHRKHASVHRLAKILPSYAGTSVKKEVEGLKLLKKADDRLLILGGVKLSTKMPLIENMANSVNFILLGSSYQSLLTRQRNSAWVDGSDKREGKMLAKLIAKYNHKIILPLDVRVLESEDSEVVVTKEANHIQPDDVVMDIGPETELRYAEFIDNADEIVWNGPLGIIENADGSEGTLSLIDALKRASGRTVIGGGDTLKLLTSDEIADFDFVSTGGGAMLSYLAGEKMPGLDVLQ